MIVHSRFTFARFAVLALAAAGLCASQAAAQIAYTEPPDLTSNLSIPTPVGNVAGGVNTVTGTLSTTWDANGNIGFLTDDADSFSFNVPPGLAVTGIQIVISNFVCNGSCFSRVRSFSAGIGSININGNGTYTVPVSGPLGAGTYNLQLYVDQSFGSGAGGASCSHQFRITAIPATNDNCLFPTTIGLGATPFDNTSATTDGPATIACGSFIDANGLGQDRWYQFVPAESGIVTASTCGATFDTAVAVYTGVCGALTQVACNDDFAACGGTGFQSQLAFTAAAGTPYRIRVGGYSTAVGTGTLTLSINTTGACCSRATGACLVLSQADCVGFGGTFVGFAAACSPGTCVACPADFNGGGLSLTDIFDFLNAWFAGCP